MIEACYFATFFDTMQVLTLSVAALTHKHTLTQLGFCNEQETRAG